MQRKEPVTHILLFLKRIGFSSIKILAPSLLGHQGNLWQSLFSGAEKDVPNFEYDLHKAYFSHRFGYSTSSTKTESVGGAAPGIQMWKSSQRDSIRTAFFLFLGVVSGMRSLCVVLCHHLKHSN